MPAVAALVSPLPAILICVVAFHGMIWLVLFASRRLRTTPLGFPSEWKGATTEGFLFVSLALDSRSWIAERRDTVGLADDLWFDYSATIVLDTTKRDAELPGCQWIPIGILPKSTTANVEIRAPGRFGGDVGTWPDHARVAEEALATMAEGILKTKCSARTANAIRAIVLAAPRKADRALRDLLRSADAEARDLRGSAEFVDLANAFAGGDLLLADIGRGRGWKWLTVSYRYRLERPRRRPHEEPGGRGSSVVVRVAEAIGWRVRPFQIDLHGPFQGNSQVWSVRLPCLRGQAAEIRSTVVTPPSSDVWREISLSEGTLTLQRLPSDPRGVYVVRLMMQPTRRSDLLRGVFFISAFISAALLLGTVRACAVSQEVEAMTVLLAVVPSLLVPLLWRGEHALVTVVFAGLRVVAVSVLVVGVVAVLTLIGHAPTTVMRWTWAVSLGVASIGLIVAGVANFVPPRWPGELRPPGR
jgi:hypothetical protein